MTSRWRAGAECGQDSKAGRSRSAALGVERREVFNLLGLRVRRNTTGLLAFVLTYQILMSPHRGGGLRAGTAQTPSSLEMTDRRRAPWFGRVAAHSEPTSPTAARRPSRIPMRQRQPYDRARFDLLRTRVLRAG
jgi:hypothetical protein